MDIAGEQVVVLVAAVAVVISVNETATRMIVSAATVGVVVGEE